MRGIMCGNNRINKYTLKSTRLIWVHANNIPNQPESSNCIDCRHSDTLAKVVADVFSANGIEVFLFSEMRPTPELSLLSNI
jgi:phosphomannomutase